MAKQKRSNNTTYVKSIKITSFRGLSNITVPLGRRITLLCGKNGTSKSSILGIAAQVFSFETDYTKNESLTFRTLTGSKFESRVSEHFRLSKKFDKPDSMDTSVSIHDGYTSEEVDLALKLYDSKDRAKPRPIVRGNTLADGENTSRNATHPVIYLSLKRLTPISQRMRYTEHDIEFLTEHRRDFVALSNKLLSKRSATSVTATTGTIKSAAAHGNNYDHDSVSAGEDNAGQILLALFSFRKLKEEYNDYKGGLLLIDEADAGLFPAAQKQLIKILTDECKDLDLQVIMTSHSPTMIEDIQKLSTLDSDNYQNIYLSDTYGPIKIQENVTWPQIYADLHVQTIPVDTNLLPKINVYFEDKEAFDLYSSIVTDRTIRKVTNTLKDVALGCTEYIKLVKRKIPEFSSKSLIVLDGDVDSTKGMDSIVKLPGTLPPDQLIFEFLFNLSPDDPYWKNKSGFTKPVFMTLCDKISDTLKIDPADEIIDIGKLISDYRDSSNTEDQRLRNHFKDFAKQKVFLKMVNGGAAQNPYRAWVKHNSDLAEDFRDRLKKALRNTMINGHGVDSALLTSLEPASTARQA
ncbi:AAA family ATPase [Pseudomonas aeruginosa]|uniref:AAA family ATPase n=1 Tax=Pseudomonas aeruginosa TaxID=287 RepID=UPI0008FBAB8C|nr:AAA family ATPase [Pseudomonas aeruginosa]KAA5628714.1 ATP-binding protein [Pseudomonas aeruginosa]KAA5641977.1 ATP-binding protein [Pseudomonas aeruginosa]MBG6487107.1 AAA family ATPase [Pseudomonas aeruginosa]MBV5980263.1 AAA family ATPase [Pseudomonas aeruginosa]MBX5852229.1 AAA family ATPase [Pseudomonas aeruginosa]